jgi:4a-hydroxytetrahydrobiopterin dehydratase
VRIHEPFVEKNLWRKKMTAQSLEQLRAQRCVPCEGGVPKLTPAEAEAQLAKLTGWKITPDGQRIRKEWIVKHFMAGIRFFNKVADVAEVEGHHPDLHIVGYRNVAIEIWTHAIGGLSENDFILAAKIDDLPIELKPSVSAGPQTCSVPV